MIMIMYKTSNATFKYHVIGKKEKLLKIQDKKRKNFGLNQNVKTNC